MILVDTNVLLDVLYDNPTWAAWSQAQLEASALTDRLVINTVIYSQLSVAFARIEELESVVVEASLRVEPIPREGLFLAAKVSLAHGPPQHKSHGILPTFYIGAHAAVSGYRLLTRDSARFRGHFPTVEFITPAVGQSR
jgi:predicted nucleic acid-binding protein